MKQRIVSFFSDDVDTLRDEIESAEVQGERIAHLSISHAVLCNFQSYEKMRHDYYSAIVIYEQDGGAE